MANIEDPSIGSPARVAELAIALTRYLVKIVKQLNSLSNGSVSASTSAASAPPASNSKSPYSQGDFIRNNGPTELGTSGSKYVITGWLCTKSTNGTQAATWVQCRALTGN